MRDNEIEDEDLSDGDLARALCAAQFNADARYVAPWGRWLFWTGARWAEDTRLEHYAHTDRFLLGRARGIVARAKAQGADPEKLALAKRAAKSLKSATKSHAVMSMCQRSGDVPAEPEQFDADPLLLGTPAGVVDLATGVMREARRSDYITKTTSVAPALPGPPPPSRWLQFLDEVFERDASLIAFMQRALGYALTGATSEQKFLFLHGAGRNGKGVLLQTVGKIMGDYARSVPSSLFVVQSGGEAHPTGIAQLRGYRLVTASEIQSGATWNESVLKDLTGGDVIPARFMRGDFFNFTPQLTLFISGNSKPTFTSMGVSMRERFLLVPFRASFTDDNGKRDPDLADTLQAEGPGILQWLIQGAGEWIRNGLEPPERVTDVSSAYLDEEDIAKAFVEDCLEQDAFTDTAVSAIYPKFCEWQEAQGVKRPWTQNRLTRRLSEDGGLTVSKTRPSAPPGAPPVSCVVGWRPKA